MVRYLVVALILTFLLMPFLTPYVFDCNPAFNSKKVASALLLFFR